MSKDVALVLASGGARGLAHIGAIEILEKRGYTIKSIAGSSMGAVVGGVYASGNMKGFSDWMKTLSKRDVFQLLDFTFNLGFVKSDRVYKEIRNIVGHHNIEELEIDLRIVATNLEEEKEYIFESGDLIEAFRASTAYPTIITPLLNDGKLLVDGGVLNPLPLNRVKRNPGDLLVCVDLGAKIPYEPAIKRGIAKSAEKNTAYTMAYNTFNKYFKDSSKKNSKEKWSYFKLVTETINVMHNRLNEMSLEHHKPDINIPISFRAADTFEFYHAHELIEYGKQQANKALDVYESQLTYKA